MTLAAAPGGLPDTLTSLDRALAGFLQSLQPSQEPRHAWLAALASHQFGRGHACLDLVALAVEPARVLGWPADKAALVPPDLPAAAATLPWCRGADSPLVLDPDGRRLYLRRAWQAEQRILAQLALRQAAQPPVPADLSARLDALFPGPTPDGGPDRQREACEVAARHAFTVITGGPGTGKTTTVARLLSLLAREATQRGQSLRVHLAAPTGKAASRLSQSIAEQLPKLPPEGRELIPTTATTLHRLLGLRSGAAAGAAVKRALVTDLVIVDEASMIDLEMMASLLEAVPASARLVLLGDKDQLASVEAGAVLAQLCERADLQSQIVRLTYSHRFAGGSAVGQWASALNAGDATAVRQLWEALPAWEVGQDLPIRRLPAKGATGGDAAAAFDAAVRQGWRLWREHMAALREGGAHCDDATARELLKEFARFQVLCALRNGPAGAEGLNAQVARALGFGREAWYAGRPVMVTRNDYALQLMNGDIGLCLPRDGQLRVAFRSAEGGAEAPLRWVLPARLEHVDTVFAMTVHKSQGSEFRQVLLVLPERGSPVLTRELLYTGLTRARQGVVWRVPELAVLQEAVTQRVLRAGGLGGRPLTC